MSPSASPPLVHRRDSRYFHMHNTSPLVFHGAFVAFLFHQDKISTYIRAVSWDFARWSGVVVFLLVVLVAAFFFLHGLCS